MLKYAVYFNGNPASDLFQSSVNSCKSASELFTQTPNEYISPRPTAHRCAKSKTCLTTLLFQWYVLSIKTLLLYVTGISIGSLLLKWIQKQWGESSWVARSQPWLASTLLSPKASSIPCSIYDGQSLISVWSDCFTCVSTCAFWVQVIANWVWCFSGSV